MKKFVAILMSLILLICFSACSSTKTNYYNMSFKYNDLEIIVTSVEESIDNNGYYDTTISFSVSNNGTQKYDLRSIDIYLKNAETKSKHNKNSISVVRSEHTEDYKVNFTLPFSVGTIKFNIYTVYIINFEQIEFFANLRNCEAIKEPIKILYFNIVSYEIINK